jgi:hypothetical protein
LVTVKLPPPLEWVLEYTASMSRAVGIPIDFDVKPTVNPLLLQVRLDWLEPMSPASTNDIWNMFQVWAAKNECVPYGKITKTPYSVTMGVIIKRRLGYGRNDNP